MHVLAGVRGTTACTELLAALEAGIGDLLARLALLGLQGLLLLLQLLLQLLQQLLLRRQRRLVLHGDGGAQATHVHVHIALPLQARPIEVAQGADS